MNPPPAGELLDVGQREGLGERLDRRGAKAAGLRAARIPQVDGGGGTRERFWQPYADVRAKALERDRPAGALILQDPPRAPTSKRT